MPNSDKMQSSNPHELSAIRATPPMPRTYLTARTFSGHVLDDGTAAAAEELLPEPVHLGRSKALEILT